MTDKALKVLLDPQHKTFADEYIITGRKAASARKAGYAENSAHVSANRLLKRPDVQAYIAARAAEHEANVDNETQRVVEELKALAFANIGDFISIDGEGQPQVDLSNATPEQLRALQSVKSKRRSIFNNKGEHVATEQESSFVMADKLRGLELLGKHYGLFKAEEQRVVVDVADRLLAARRRLRAAYEDDSENSVPGGGG